MDVIHYIQLNVSVVHALDIWGQIKSLWHQKLLRIRFLLA